MNHHKEESHDLLILRFDLCILMNEKDSEMNWLH
jgi:hypothetical protein